MEDRGSATGLYAGGACQGSKSLFNDGYVWVAMADGKEWLLWGIIGYWINKRLMGQQNWMDVQWLLVWD